MPCKIERESLKSLTVATRQHMPMNLRLVLMAPVLYSSPRPSPPRQGAPAYSLALAIEMVPVRVVLRRMSGPSIQNGTRVRISLWDSLMFGRAPGGSWVDAMRGAVRNKER